MRTSVNQPLRARAERVVGASTPSESAVFKWVIAEKPWLYVIAYYIYSYPGLTLEELREASKLRASVVKRGVWWLRKYSVVEERSGRLFIARGYAKILESLVTSTCRAGGAYVVLVDRVYIVFRSLGGKIEYWSLPADLYNKLYQQRSLTEQCSPERVASTLRVSAGTARRLCLLLELLGEYRGAGVKQQL
jgi:hypothetical protein